MAERAQRVEVSTLTRKADEATEATGADRADGVKAYLQSVGIKSVRLRLGGAGLVSTTKGR